MFIFVYPTECDGKFIRFLFNLLVVKGLNAFWTSDTEVENFQQMCQTLLYCVLSLKSLYIMQDSNVLNSH